MAAFKRIQDIQVRHQERPPRIQSCPTALVGIDRGAGRAAGGICDTAFSK